MSTGNKTSATEVGPGPFDAALETLAQWDPGWTATSQKMAGNPWNSGVLPRKLVELISVGLNAGCTMLNPAGTRHHIRAALDAGATKEEILLVLKCASVYSIHTLSLAAPILLTEAEAAGVKPADKPLVSTPACDKMKAVGQWNAAWDPFYQLDPEWTDEFMATGIGIYASGIMNPRDLELLSIALDASVTHMYAPGTQRHIQNALRAGATVAEIMEALKICVALGFQSCNLGVPILAEELAKRS